MYISSGVFTMNLEAKTFAELSRVNLHRGIIFAFKRYRNTYYIVTDHAVYISSGVFTMNLEAKTFAELSRVNLHRGIFD